jgi:CBS domain containing-hemolysin-like protein
MPNDGEPPQRGSFRQRLARLIAGQAASVAAAPASSAAVTAPTAIRLRLKEFETATVRDVMTSRIEIAAVEIETTLGQLMNIFATEAHSRMPVYRDSLDEPLGFVHIKDAVAEGVRCGWTAETLASKPLARLIREVMFVPESTPLPDLLIRMQASRIHIALVIDEYGGTGGMVCLEDLVEQIVGDIDDEHDEAPPLIARRSKSSWEVAGLATIDDVVRETGLPVKVEDFETEVDTFGGLISAIAGRVPAVGETIEHPRGLTIEIIEADPRRVIRAKLRGPRAAPSALAEGKTAAVDH